VQLPAAPEPNGVVMPDLPPAKGDKKTPPAAQAPQAPQDVRKDDCDVCRADPALTVPAARETFGTAVTFMRSRAEASRVAAQEDKLTFVLHVSGNFEEARFT